jgi:hypothetical protein
VLSEEQVLLSTFGAEYRDYAARVPCFVPRPGLWAPPAAPWSWRMALRREHDSVFAAVALFAGICHYRDWLVTGRWTFDRYLGAFACAAFAAWLVIKCLKRCTRVLNVRRAGQPGAGEGEAPGRGGSADGGPPAGGGR